VPQCPIACDANVGQVQESGSLTKVHGHETKNVTKVVGATSSECFLVVSIDALQSAVNAVVRISVLLSVCHSRHLCQNDQTANFFST